MRIVVLDEVKRFLSSLTPGEISKTLRTVDLLEQFGNDLGLPHSRHLTGGILELRVRGKRELRILYCFYNKKAVLLTMFVKKSQKTPDAEIRRARILVDQLQKYII